MRTKPEWRVFGGLAAFLFPFAALYWLAADEHGVAIALLSTELALLFLGAYLFVLARRTGAHPEDQPDAGLLEAAGEVGEFPTRSPWPAVMGVAASLTGFGLVFSRWLVLPGLLFLLLATVGYAAEAQRARH